MYVEAWGDAPPRADSTTVHSMVVPGAAASKTICREPCPAVITPPPPSVHVQLEPGWFTTLAEAPEAPTGTETGAVITGSKGVTFTVTVTFATFVDAQPLAPVTVSAYTVVDAGFAVGVQLKGSESPVIGSHEHDTPPEPSRSAVSPVQRAPPP